MTDLPNLSTDDLLMEFYESNTKLLAVIEVNKDRMPLEVFIEILRAISQNQDATAEMLKRVKLLVNPHDDLLPPVI